MAEERKSFKHTIALDQRERCAITGVMEVISFDEETVIAETEMGILIVKGINLHVSRLNLESGDLEIDGEIGSLHYEEQSGYAKGKPSILGKLFR